MTVPSFGTAAVVEDTSHVLLAQAQAFFTAGATAHAAGILHRLPLSVLEPADWLDYTRITLGVQDDLQDSQLLVDLSEQCESLVRTLPRNSDRWLVANAARNYANLMRVDGKEVGAAYAATRYAFSRLTSMGEGFAISRAHFLVSTVERLAEAGRWGEAERAVRDAQQSLRRIGRVPPSIAAELHLDRFYLQSASSETWERAASEARSAYEIARACGLIRTVWLCLYLAVPESMGNASYDRALAYAQELVDVVNTGESVGWRRLALSRLALSLTALDRLDEAERVLATIPCNHRSDPAYALPRCGVLVRSRRHREAHAYASAIADDYERHGWGLYRANALFYRATASWKLHDAPSAIDDIRETIRIYDSQHAPALFLLRRAYGLAYAITKDPRYRSAERDLQRILERRATQTEQQPFLTSRQFEIASLAARGLTNRAIADRLGISARTVANHLNAVYTALQVRARWQLAEALGQLH